jgi:nucleotide-binding universal stress UspA family protein
MYRKILVALENSEADTALLPHVAALAKRLGSELILMHVAHGWAARHYNHLQLAESEEMKADRQYLGEIKAKLQSENIAVSARLALGDPPREILRVAQQESCDLIAMTTHGHRLIGDLLFGSTIHEVRHRSSIPILLVRAGTAPPDPNHAGAGE